MDYKIVNEKNNSTIPEKTPETKDFNVDIEDPKWTLSELVLSSAIKDEINEIVAYRKNQDFLLNDWEFKKFLKAGKGICINFFGKPGTGKTVTADAIADKLGVKIIKITYAQLESELMGRTSKNLSDLFEIAQKSKSLLFFDEADTLLSKRISNSSSPNSAEHSINSVKGRLLQLIEDFDGIIIFATNIFENYDEAFLRRILFNIKFTPPDPAMLVQLWKFHLSDKIPKEITYERAAEISEGLAGGDIKNLAFKLALKLLTKKDRESFSPISEDMLKEEIQKYLDINEEHKKEPPLKILPQSLKILPVDTHSNEKID
jgi:SpoVK/Ycf46/Vps4 family AAA+-type ATPase